MKIVFLSHTPRNAVFKVGSVHLSNWLARMGHEVLYISSAISPFHLLNIAAFKDENYRQTFKNRVKSSSAYKDDDGVTNLTPLVLTPFHKGIFDQVDIPLNKKFTFNRVKTQIANAGFGQVDLVIQDRPGLFFMRNFIEADRWLYRATDDYSTMAGGASESTIQELEKIICRFADQVIVTSQPLQQKFKQRYGVEATIVRNGVDVAHFSKKRKVPEEYRSINRPIILYVGSFDERFDTQLLHSIISESGEYHFVLIGPGSKKLMYHDTPNVSLLGARPYQQVPAYMQHADVGMLPLKLIPANHARSPMKMYEYGLSGLPVVATPLREMEMRSEEFITFAKTGRQFYTAIKSCMEQQASLSAVGREQSKSHSWETIAQRVIAL